MILNGFDWVVLALYFGFTIGIGLYYRRRAQGSTDEYFRGGGKVSWWVAGTSMVATTFAADTPLAVTGIVAKNGIAGNWLWWNMLFSSMLTVFFFARLWRRANILTDVEFAEYRYSGAPAAILRGFRALYLSIPVNLIVLGWVNLAMVKILGQVFPDLMLFGMSNKMTMLTLVFGMMIITAFVSTLSGLWGVLVTDVFQFALAMGMVVALAYFAVAKVGGMDGLITKIQALDAAKAAAGDTAAGAGGSLLSFTPDLNSAWMPLTVFFVYIGVTWWASWYPGAEPGGGGYIVQRVLCAKNEKHSLLATLWFSIAHYAVRPWPWILTALVTLVLYPDLQDKEAGYVKVFMDPEVFPVQLRGLMLAAFMAAYMSTIATQLNWGASYLVNDFYRRFAVRGKTEAHYVNAGKGATVLLMVLSIAVTSQMDTISGAWKFLMAVGAGTGSVFILRWFWWRINAWSEISSMIASFITSMFLDFYYFVKVHPIDDSDPHRFAYTVLITVAVTTVVWLATTFLTPPEDKAVLLRFYRKVAPTPTLWGPIAREARDVTPKRDELHNLICWAAGCMMIYMILFGTGKLLFGETATGLLFFAIAAISAGVIYWDLNARGWAVITDDGSTDDIAPPASH